LGRLKAPTSVTRSYRRRAARNRLGLASATHVAAGETVSIRRRFRLELTLFAKWLNGLPVRSLQPATRLGQTLLGTAQDALSAASSCCGKPSFQKNQEELACSSDFSRIGSVSGLPTLAVVGVTLER
jgi:hypothetical protein